MAAKEDAIAALAALRAQMVRNSYGDFERINRQIVQVDAIDALVDTLLNP